MIKIENVFKKRKKNVLKNYIKSMYRFFRASFTTEQNWLQFDIALMLLGKV